MPIGEIIVAFIAAIFAGGGLGGLISALIVWRKLPYETRRIDADTGKASADAAKGYAESAKTSAEACRELAAQLVDALHRIDELECERDLLKAEVAALRRLMADKDADVRARDSIIVHLQSQINEQSAKIGAMTAQIRVLEKRTTGELKARE